MPRRSVGDVFLGAGLVGGKAAGLDRLVAAGERVPAYVVLRPADDPAAAPAALGGIRFAVRSSAAAEDGEQTAHAGLFASFLDVAAADLPNRVRRVRASFGDQAGAVIVQRMVAAEVSGVAFSVHPRGIRDQVVVSAGAGPGAVVVDGGATRTWVTSTVDGRRYSHGDAPVDLLTGDQVDEIVAAALRIQASQGRPVDIEWAYAEGALHLLQARPITTLHRTQLTGDPTTLDNSNLVESYPGLVSPLTASFVPRAYAGVFRSLARRITGERAIVAAYEDVVTQMIGQSNGRLYYRMESWYAVLALMPFARRFIRVWQNSLGVAEREYAPSPVRISRWRRVRTAAGVIRELVRTPAELTSLAADVAAVQQRFWSALEASRSTSDLRELFDHLEARLLQRWDVTLLNDVRAFVLPALLRVLVRDDARVHRLVSGIGGIESLRPVIELTALAADLPAEVASISTAEEMADYLRSAGGYPARLRGYIEQFGDRCLEELKLESPTFRTDPLLLIDAVRAAAAGLGTGRSRERAVDHEITGPPWVRALSRAAMAAIAARETSRLDRARVYGMVRAIALRAGTLLAAQGRLAAAEDVWWLTLDELWSGAGDLRATVRGRRRDHTAWAALPAFRRVTFSGEPFDVHVHASSTETGTTSGDLAGLGVSAGTASGDVAIVRDPRAAGDIAGKVLVTTVTDPGWVFLLSRAAGIVAERGSLLSHTAIVARELGVPAVVGVPDATALLNEGERVTVDGDRGEVRRCTASA